MSLIRPIFLAVSLLLATAAHADGVNNGSLTARIDNDGVPPGWLLLAGSPDVMDGGNNVGVAGLQRFGARPDASPDGGTWMGLGVNGDLRESFGQKIEGLTVGALYELSWFGGNFGYMDGSIRYTDGNSLMAFDSVSGETLGQGSLLSLASDWKSESISFVAQSSTLNLGFRLSDASRSSYLSIDGIKLSTVTPVPESSTVLMAMLGLVGVGLAVRRRAA